MFVYNLIKSFEIIDSKGSKLLNDVQLSSSLSTSGVSVISAIVNSCSKQETSNLYFTSDCAREQFCYLKSRFISVVWAIN